LERTLSRNRTHHLTPTERGRGKARYGAGYASKCPEGEFPPFAVLPIAAIANPSEQLECRNPAIFLRQIYELIDD